MSALRYRRTSAELARVDDAIAAAVEADKPVTLRGVFYRVVSMGAIEKTEESYHLIGRRLRGLRQRRVIAYTDITDGSRVTFRPNTFTGVDDVLDAAASSYRRALWLSQDAEVHIYSEKDAITGVVYPITYELDVPLGIMRGYSSDTFTYLAARAIAAAAQDGRDVYVYQLGDHDPSGADAWRSFQAKVEEFLGSWFAEGSGEARFARLAVTPAQIDGLGLPTRPTKASDPRAASFAGESVEVDAIPAPELRRIVREAIEAHIDAEALRITREAERSEREVLERLAGEHARE